VSSTHVFSIKLFYKIIIIFKNKNGFFSSEYIKATRNRCYEG